jgi:uncharacterized RDD family membrane protein YckC
MKFFQRECASPWLRLGAAFIDGFLVLIVSALIYPVSAGDRGFAALPFLVVSWLYFAGMESSRRRATLGKRLLGLEVTNLQGQRISFPRATLRMLAKYLSWFPMGFGYLSFFLSRRKQGLHDMAAGTLVVER